MMPTALPILILLLSCSVSALFDYPVHDPCACMLNPSCMQPINQDPDVQASLDQLFRAFLSMDLTFNTYGTLTVSFVMSRGFFDELSTAVILGPFPDAHEDHSVKAGASLLSGNKKISTAFSNLGNALMHDPNWPYDTLDASPKIFHDYPIATAYGVWNQYYVSTSESVHYQGDNEPTTRLSPVVANLNGLALYHLNCDCNSKPQVPAIIWADYNLIYVD